jgi:hypothetical protein
MHCTVFCYTFEERNDCGIIPIDISLIVVVLALVLFYYDSVLRRLVGPKWGHD